MIAIAIKILANSKKSKKYLTKRIDLHILKDSFLLNFIHVWVG
jgi:hypothetical protein